ncbi:MAG: PrsW family intramembrane metalloprotease [Chloroflexota bacterium]
MPFLVSLFFGFTPMLFFAVILYWSDRYEKEPWILLGVVFLWGAIIAAGGAFLINTILGVGVFIFSNSEAATNLATGSLIAPVVEELLKGFSVFVVFLIFRKEFDSILDGIIYAGVTALGFAATENTYYIFNNGFLESGWQGLWSLVFIRVVLVGWQHPFYSAFTGIGLAISRLSKSLWIKIVASLAGFSLAIVIHSIHNTIATFLSGLSGMAIGTMIDWTGWFFMFIFILWAIHREQQVLKKFLYEEVKLGNISSNNYKIAISSWSQMIERITALFSGHFLKTQRFYQLCGELAHKKSQFAELGNENGNLATIKSIQAELIQLAPLV